MESSLLYIVIGIILYLIVVLYKKFYVNKYRGARGERRVARKLKRLNKEDYKVYNNLYLRINDRTTQIDHLVISIYGVFVIETKTYKGWIYGNESSKYWTQTLYRKKHKIYNPIIQNWSHINFLKKVSAEFRNLIYFQIIVFAGSAKLKNVESPIPVIYKRKLLRTIKRKKEIYLTHNLVERLDNILQREILDKKEIRKEHKKFVKKQIKKNKGSSISQVCPKCGGILFIRNGKYGKFYGCSNFPQCSHTRNV